MSMIDAMVGKVFQTTKILPMQLDDFEDARAELYVSAYRALQKARRRHFSQKRTVNYVLKRVRGTLLDINRGRVLYAKSRYPRNYKRVATISLDVLLNESCFE